MEKDLKSSTLAGSALMSVVNVNKEIQEQQMNIVRKLKRRKLPLRMPDLL